MATVTRILSESLSLVLFQVTAEGGRVFDVPVVNGWAQIDLQLLRIPVDHEDEEFWRRLASMRNHLRQNGDVAHWFFLHKEPGIRLRFQVGERPDNILDAVANDLSAFELGWIRPCAFGSYFAQAELMNQTFQREFDRILTASADEYLHASADKLTADEGRWSTFVICFLNAFLRDSWLVWEALGRFQRLRSHPYQSLVETSQAVLKDPCGILNNLPKPTRPGFEVSVTLLQCLNYLFNMWMVEPSTQIEILRKARASLQPDIVKR